MSVTINLWSRNTGDIKNFLESYYEKDMEIDNDVDQWIYVYRKPLDTIDLIGAVIDNSDKYNISMCIQLNDGNLYPITYENHNDVIKGLLCLFYTESPESYDFID